MDGPHRRVWPELSSASLLSLSWLSVWFLVFLSSEWGNEFPFPPNQTVISIVRIILVVMMVVVMTMIDILVVIMAILAFMLCCS